MSLWRYSLGHQCCLHMLPYYPATSSCAWSNLQAIWKISLCLSSGLWPSQDWQGHQWPAQSRDAQRVGTQLAGGHAAMLWNTREELEFLALHLVSDTTASLCQAARNEVCLSSLLWAIQTTRAERQITRAKQLKRSHT